MLILLLHFGNEIIVLDHFNNFEFGLVGESFIDIFV